MGKFERGLKRKVRQRVNASPELVRVRRRARSRQSGAWFWRGKVLFFAAMLVFAWYPIFESARTYLAWGGFDLLLLVMAGGWLLAAVATAGVHRESLHNDGSLKQCAYRPQPDSACFCAALRTAFAGGTVTTLYFMLPFYAVLGMAAAATWQEWLGLSLSVLAQAGLFAALTSTMVACWPRRREAWSRLVGAAAMVGLGFLLLILPSLAPATDVPLDFSPAADVGLTYLPTAWVPGAFLHGFVLGQPEWRWLLIPAGVLLLLAPLLTYQAVRRFQIHEFALSPPHIYAVLTADMLPEGLAATESEDRETIRQRLRQRNFLQPFALQRVGWLERLFDALLTARQRQVAEILLPKPPRCTSDWKKVGIAVLMLLVVMLLPLSETWKAGGILFFLFGIVFFAIMRPWLTTSLTSTHRFLPALGYLPIHYREFASLYWKMGLCKLAAVVPLLAIAVAVAATAPLEGAAEISSELRHWCTSPLFGFLALWFYAYLLHVAATGDSGGPIYEFAVDRRWFAAGRFVLVWGGIFLLLYVHSLSPLAGCAAFGVLLWAICRLTRYDHERRYDYATPDV